MINVLEFNSLHEYKHAWNMSARACYHIYENLDKCMMLYRYKLSDGFIWQKFGVSDPNNIKLEKLQGDSLFIFHLDIYEKSTDKLSELLDYCLENNIEVFIPIKSDYAPVKQGVDDKHISIIKDILDKYETTKYDLTNISYNKTSEIESSIIEATKLLIRDAKLRNLLD